MHDVDVSDWTITALRNELAEYKEKFQHQCRLNLVLVNQNALLVERNTALEQQVKQEKQDAGPTFNLPDRTFYGVTYADPPTPLPAAIPKGTKTIGGPNSASSALEEIPLDKDGRYTGRWYSFGDVDVMSVHPNNINWGERGTYNGPM